MKKTLFHIPPT